MSEGKNAAGLHISVVEAAVAGAKGALLPFNKLSMQKFVFDFFSSLFAVVGETDGLEIFFRLGFVAVSVFDLPPFSLSNEARRCWRSSCFCRFFSSRSFSRFSISSGGMGSPEQVMGWALCAGLPGP